MPRKCPNYLSYVHGYLHSTIKRLNPNETDWTGFQSIPRDSERTKTRRQCWLVGTIACNIIFSYQHGHRDAMSSKRSIWRTNFKIPFYIPRKFNHRSLNYSLLTFLLSFRWTQVHAFQNISKAQNVQLKKT